MAKTECFKVVRVATNGDLVSAIDQGDFTYELTYVPGAVTRPTIGKIFVFDSFNNARYFLGTNTHQEIWRAIGENVKPRKKILHWAYLYAPGIYLFWTDFKRTQKHLHIKHAPSGTYLADSLMLIEKVYPPAVQLL